MEKIRNGAGLAICVIIAALALGALTAGSKEMQKKFRGEIIYIGDSSVEIKKGRKDLTFAISGETRFVDIDGKPGEMRILEICQVVDALYAVKDRENILLKITVLKESICKK